jgi:endonuclease/exonuclease/phosphatase family metal-dependent hydrolase
LFISGDLAVEEVKVPADGVVRTASDHLPFFVQLRLPEITASHNSGFQ